MSYSAVITPIVNIRPHSNADRLNIGNALGYQVIVSKDIKEGTLGIFFPEDGQLSETICRDNNLYSKKEMNADPEAKGGFFGKHRRVRAQKLRGEISMGFWSELHILKCFGLEYSDLANLKKGQFLTEINDQLVCNKYYTPATQKAMAGKSKGKNSRKSELKEKFINFAMHYDTKQMRMNAGNIPYRSIIYVSEKIHGTSARTGRLICEKHLTGFQKFWNKVFGEKYKSREYKYVSGSRRVTLKFDQRTIGQMRHVLHDRVKEIGLREGETLYYEIVGYDENNRLIMDSHGIEDSKLKKRYGNEMRYTYGCTPGQCKMYIYRITYTLPDGFVVEASYDQIIKRCSHLGLNVVPMLEGPFVYDGQPDKLMELCEKHSQGSSVLDDSHIREGVVVKVEHPDMQEALKYKGYHFCALEGIRKNSSDYVDPEEVG